MKKTRDSYTGFLTCARCVRLCICFERVKKKLSKSPRETSNYSESRACYNGDCSDAYVWDKVDNILVNFLSDIDAGRMQDHK